MKRLRRMFAAVVAMVSLLSIGALAGNQYKAYAFESNGVTVDSASNYKVDDGDMKAYVTTLSLYDGTVSNVFPNNGTFYARSRRQVDTSVKSGLFTFTSNTSKTANYSSDVVFDSYYILRAEIDNTNFTGRAMYQCVKWCP